MEKNCVMGMHKHNRKNTNTASVQKELTKRYRSGPSVASGSSLPIVHPFLDEPVSVYSELVMEATLALQNVALAPKNH